MDAKNVWVANDEGSEIIRAREIAGASLDYDGNVTVRLTGGDGAAVTIAGHREHHEGSRPADFHRDFDRDLHDLLLVPGKAHSLEGDDHLVDDKLDLHLFV